MTATKERVTYGTKVCPRCGSELYEDMTVCYGCLYDFSRAPAEAAELPPCPDAPRDEPVGEDTEDLSAAASRAAPAEGRAGLWLQTSSADVWVEVGEKGLLVGRDPRCDVVLHSPAVSRRHVRLASVAEGMEVFDLGSTNPATYRGRKVTQRAVVPFGDTVELCGCRLTMTGPPAARQG